MTAKGKINASKVQVGDRIIVRNFESNFRTGTLVCPSDTKTGEGVHVARVTGKSFRSAQGHYESRGKYVIETTSGTFASAPIQTMFLAPEDAAGIKRAHVEALAEDETRYYASLILEQHVEALAENAERVQEEAARLAAIADRERAPEIHIRIPGLDVTACFAVERDDARMTSDLEAATCPKCLVALDLLAAPDTRYRIRFDRIGRSHDVPDLHVRVPAVRALNLASVLSQQIHAYAARFLVSYDYVVDVDMANLKVWIEGGRFGSGVVSII